MAQNLRSKGMQVALAYDMTEENLCARQERGLCTQAIYLRRDGSVQKYE